MTQTFIKVRYYHSRKFSHVPFQPSPAAFQSQSLFWAFLHVFGLLVVKFHTNWKIQYVLFFCMWTFFYSAKCFWDSSMFYMYQESVSFSCWVVSPLCEQTTADFFILLLMGICLLTSLFFSNFMNQVAMNPFVQVFLWP